MNDLKHKTVGVSFHPELRQRAVDRARMLGLTFSRYVALCVENQLSASLEAAEPKSSESLSQMLKHGAEPDVNLERAIESGGEYSEAKAQSIGFEEDIEDILKAEEFCFARMAKVAHLRTDFLVQHALTHSDRVCKIAVECKYSIRNRYTVTLGQAIILKSLPGIDAVLLCVPYTRNFDTHVLETFRQQQIPVTTPDTLTHVLSETFAALEKG